MLRLIRPVDAHPARCRCAQSRTVGRHLRMHRGDSQHEDSEDLQKRKAGEPAAYADRCCDRAVKIETSVSVPSQSDESACPDGGGDLARGQPLVQKVVSRIYLRCEHGGCQLLWCGSRHTESVSKTCRRKRRMVPMWNTPVDFRSVQGFRPTPWTSPAAPSDVHNSGRKACLVASATPRLVSGAQSPEL